MIRLKITVTWNSGAAEDFVVSGLGWAMAKQALLLRAFPLLGRLDEIASLKIERVP